MPSGGCGGVVPAWARTKAPVPSVSLAVPASQQRSPNSEACWSPTAARIGIPPAVGFDRVGVDDRRQDRARDAEQLEQLVVPVGPAQRAQQRAARVAGVAHVDAGEPEQQPGRDVAVGEIPAAGVIEHPAQLGRREGRVELEPGALADPWLVLAQRGARLVGAAVLPDDRRMDGPPGRAVPDHEGLGLVRDAERSHLGGPRPRALDRLHRRRDERLGVLLDQPGPRERAADGDRRRAELAQLGVERDAARARRALVETEDDGHRRAIT